jgi:hypothetical protein
MSTTAQLRAVVVELIAFAAAEEETLLASAASDVADPGNERRWAAVVRGFWHPTGHVADYYLGHSRPGRAVGLQQHMLATTRYLDAPNQVAGRGCVQFLAG